MKNNNSLKIIIGRIYLLKILLFVLFIILPLSIYLSRFVTIFVLVVIGGVGLLMIYEMMTYVVEVRK